MTQSKIDVILGWFRIDDAEHDHSRVVVHLAGHAGEDGLRTTWYSLWTQKAITETFGVNPGECGGSMLPRTIKAGDLP